MNSFKQKYYRDRETIYEISVTNKFNVTTVDQFWLQMRTKMLTITFKPHPIPVGLVLCEVCRLDVGVDHTHTSEALKGRSV